MNSEASETRGGPHHGSGPARCAPPSYVSTPEHWRADYFDDSNSSDLGYHYNGGPLRKFRSQS